MRKIILKDEDGVIAQLVVEIEKCCKSALKESNAFRIGLSGGSVLNFLSAAIPRLGENCELEKWKFFFCDERFVSESDPESTLGCYKHKLIPQSSFKVEQFVAIDLQLSLDACATDYEQKIRREFGQTEETDSDVIPSFDLLLLGMGPDGHTCSLFPEHVLLREEKRLIAPIDDSPKPPPKRVTMTLPLINQAKCCIFAMCGAGKAEMVKRVFVDREDLPAAQVAPQDGELVCICDETAGKFLKS